MDGLRQTFPPFCNNVKGKESLPSASSRQRKGLPPGGGSTSQGIFLVDDGVRYGNHADIVKAPGILGGANLFRWKPHARCHGLAQRRHGPAVTFEVRGLGLQRHVFHQCHHGQERFRGMTFRPVARMCPAVGREASFAPFDPPGQHFSPGPEQKAREAVPWMEVRREQHQSRQLVCQRRFQGGPHRQGSPRGRFPPPRARRCAVPPPAPPPYRRARRRR